MKTSRTLLSLLTVFLILAVVAGAVAWKVLRDEEPSAQARPDLPDTDGVQVASADQFGGAVVVEGAEVIQDTLWIHVIASGHAEPYRKSTVASRSSGIVMEVRVRENQRVQAGDVLVRLDTLEASLDLAQARAGLIQAQADYDERMLFSGNILPDEASRQELERIIRAASGLEQAEVNLLRAQMNMANTEVRAPFTGRIADLRAVEGAFLGSGAEVLTLAQLSPIKVEVNVGEADVVYMEAGRAARVRLSAYDGEVFDGRVESANPLLDLDARSARVTIVIPNTDERIRPGMWAEASIDARAYPGRVLVPREALLDRGEQRRPMVFMASGVGEDGQGTAEWRYVTPGLRNQTHVEILDHPETQSLRAGEIVLVDGHHTLGHQVRIRLVENVRVEGGRPGR
jgi:membrane fusion protein, multidrug efflux system